MDGDALLRAVTGNPDEDAAALVFADWLQENGATGLAVALRAAVHLRRDHTVHLVTSGEYSDYRAVGAFSSRENAETFMNAARDGKTWRDFNDIEEYELDQGIEPIQSGLRPFDVAMLATGDEADVTPSNPEYVTGIVHPRGWHRMLRRRADAIIVSVWARDEQHAIEIANEKRIAYLADPARGKKP